MDYSLYKYWVVGLSHSLQINTFGENLMPILITLVVYLFLPTAVRSPCFKGWICAVWKGGDGRMIVLCILLAMLSLFLFLKLIYHAENGSENQKAD